MLITEVSLLVHTVFQQKSNKTLHHRNFKDSEDRLLYFLTVNLHETPVGARGQRLEDTQVDADFQMKLKSFSIAQTMQTAVSDTRQKQQQHQHIGCFYVRKSQLLTTYAVVQLNN